MFTLRGSKQDRGVASSSAANAEVKRVHRCRVVAESPRMAKPLAVGTESRVVTLSVRVAVVVAEPANGEELADLAFY